MARKCWQVGSLLIKLFSYLSNLAGSVPHSSPLLVYHEGSPGTWYMCEQGIGVGRNENTNDIRGLQMCLCHHTLPLVLR